MTPVRGGKQGLSQRLGHFSTGLSASDLKKKRNPHCLVPWHLRSLILASSCSTVCGTTLLLHSRVQVLVPFCFCRGQNHIGMHKHKLHRMPDAVQSIFCPQAPVVCRVVLGIFTRQSGDFWALQVSAGAESWYAQPDDLWLLKMSCIIDL